MSVINLEAQFHSAFFSNVLDLNIQFTQAHNTIRSLATTIGPL